MVRAARQPWALHGMVATSHPLAAQIGLDVLKPGGNAIDAAIAVNAALGLMEPMSCGIGGDLFAMVWDAKTRQALRPQRQRPGAGQGHAAIVRRARGSRDSRTSARSSWSVPGCVDGWDELHKRFGKAPWASLLEPSIRYAEEGFPVTEVIAGYWHGGRAAWLAAPRTRPADLPPRWPGPPGRRRLQEPDLARSYRIIADGGRDAFYKGRSPRRSSPFRTRSAACSR